MKKYAEEFSSSLNRTAVATVASTAVLTWFFSAMQCNGESCYTTDNPITQVALAGTLAVATVMAATSAPVIEKINQAKTYLAGVFSSKKAAEVKPVDAAPAESPIAEQEAALSRTKSGLFTPRGDSLQTNASEISASPQRTPSPSPKKSP